MHKAIIIGGSAGSFTVITKLLNALPSHYPFTIFICLHRLKHIRSGFVEALSTKSNITITEPNDKEHIYPGRAYLAPANYHMFIEVGHSIALSTEESVNHSRPSIDLSFITAAKAYRDKLLGIILSGANKDGAEGLRMVKAMNGTTIVQNPRESEITTMPESAVKVTDVDYIFNTDEIVKYLLKL